MGERNASSEPNGEHSERTVSEMNTQELYIALMNLCETNEAFFFKDFIVDEGTQQHTYRIFNYRLATWAAGET